MNCTQDELNKLLSNTRFTFSINCHSGLARYVSEDHQCGCWRCRQKRNEPWDETTENQAALDSKLAKAKFKVEMQEQMKTALNEDFHQQYRIAVLEKKVADLEEVNSMLSEDNKNLNQTFRYMWSCIMGRTPGPPPTGMADQQMREKIDAWKLNTKRLKALERVWKRMEECPIDLYNGDFYDHSFSGTIPKRQSLGAAIDKMMKTGSKYYD